jgi:hypothetical protein
MIQKTFPGLAITLPVQPYDVRINPTQFWLTVC